MDKSTRVETLCQQNIFVVDGMIPEGDVGSFYDLVLHLPFRRIEKDFAGDNYPIFSVDFDVEKFENEVSIGSEARNLLSASLPGKTFKLSRAYINMSHYGDIEYPHRDCDLHESNMTVLYYVNRKWDYTWGGETMFYEGSETRLAILPKPGRFVIFPGNIEHIGSIPTRVCSASRLTLALKYIAGS